MTQHIGECGKRGYASRRAARRAHASASWRLRVYFCFECKAHHVTANEKR